MNSEWLIACQCSADVYGWPVGRRTGGARKNRMIVSVQIKITIGNTSNCLFRAMIEAKSSTASSYVSVYS